MIIVFGIRTEQSLILYSSMNSIMIKNQGTVVTLNGEILWIAIIARCIYCVIRNTVWTNKAVWLNQTLWSTSVRLKPFTIRSFLIILFLRHGVLRRNANMGVCILREVIMSKDIGIMTNGLMLIINGFIKRKRKQTDDIIHSNGWLKQEIRNGIIMSIIKRIRIKVQWRQNMHVSSVTGIWMVMGKSILMKSVGICLQPTNISVCGSDRMLCLRKPDCCKIL